MSIYHMNNQNNKPRWYHIIQSILAAFIGVQSKGKAKKDFEQGDFKIYALIGIIAVVVFILTIVMVVNWVTA